MRVLAVAAVLTLAVAAPAAGAPSLASSGCPLFPADNVWHADVSRLPVHPRSGAYLEAMGAGAGIHADFGSGTWEGGPIGIPYTVVGAGQPRVPVRFGYAGESDPGPYPVPPDAPVEGGPDAGGDRHVLVVQAGSCRLYELFDAHREGGGWRAGSGAVWDLRSNRLRPAGWTSADAAGLPILAGLVRYEEVARGRVDHAIRVTVDRSQASFLWPARHHAGQAGASLPPMGLRLRLRAGVELGGFPYQARVILQAMRTHGLVVADNGSSGFIGGVPDERWDNNALQQLRRVTLADFEAVDTSGLRVSPASAAARGAARSGPDPAATAVPARTAAGAAAVLPGVGRRVLVEPRVGSAPGPATPPTTPVPDPAAARGSAPEPPALLPQVLTVVLGLTAAALAAREVARRTRAHGSPTGPPGGGGPPAAMSGPRSRPTRTRRPPGAHDRPAAAASRVGRRPRSLRRPARRAGGPMAGGADVLRGIGMFLGTPGVRLLGIVPVLLAGVLVLALLGLLVVYLDELADALTPFADRWDESSRTLVRVGTGLVVLLGSTALLVVSFTVICQIIGQPFYERISDRIEHDLGVHRGGAGQGAPWWRSFPRASLESALLLAMTLACTAPLFVLGLFPVFGQTVVPVLQTLVAGFFLAVELLAIPLERRGLHLAGRLRFVWRHRGQTLGFGITAFLLFLVPLMNVLAMPGAVVGATLLVRRLSGDQVVRPGPR